MIELMLFDVSLAWRRHTEIDKSRLQRLPAKPAACIGAGGGLSLDIHDGSVHTGTFVVLSIE
jgi:hypothetical protein